MKKAISTVLVFLIAFTGICSFEMANPAVANAASVSISCSSKVTKGSTNPIKIKGKKKTTYYIRIKCPKGSWSSSKTVTGKLKHKKTDSSGKATWKFKVGQGSTSKGTYKIYIYSDSKCKKTVATKTFKVR